VTHVTNGHDVPVETPDTSYAVTTDGVHIAYQVTGAGPKDLVFAWGLTTSVDSVWDIPQVASQLRKLAAFSRLILFDRRGAGVSDRPSGDTAPPLETSVGDILAVLDAVGSERATLLGQFDGGMVSALFAATEPARTDGLILHAPTARGLPAPDYPWAWTMEEWDGFIATVESAWGTPRFTEEFLAGVAPSIVRDPATIASWARTCRQCGSPASIAALQRMVRDSDIRPILPSIQVPTLVTHRVDDEWESIEQSRYVADQIPGARFVALPGRDYVTYLDEGDALVGEIEQFLTGTRRPPALDRILATVLFTDIVGSTAHAARLGDTRWKELLARHDEAAAAQIARHLGTYIHTTGDGLLATFDGPARAVRCAQAIADAVRELGLEVRAGCHTGEVELVGEDIQGLAVHIGARVAALAGPSEVLVSSTVKDLVAGSGLTFEDAGEHELKGVPDRWRLYRVVG
jgi:class 3 adenylate cyclase/alpha-beta hydrolase superfamily lysophospholipase